MLQGNDRVHRSAEGELNRPPHLTAVYFESHNGTECPYVVKIATHPLSRLLDFSSSFAFLAVFSQEIAGTDSLIRAFVLLVQYCFFFNVYLKRWLFTARQSHVISHFAF